MAYQANFRSGFAERFLNVDVNVKQWWIALVLPLLFGCRGEGQEATATVSPAEPRPAPTQTAAMDDRTTVTTSGSPAPADAPAPGTQYVTVSATGISMRELIPRGHTAFHIRNESAASHDLVLRSASGVVTEGSVAPLGHSVLQARLSEQGYELVCTSPGHTEQAKVTTYVPGSPLR